MASYRIYMIDEDGTRHAPMDAKCDNDADALALAQRMIAKPRAIAEVWRGDRMVATVAPVSAAEINGFASPYGRADTQ